MRKKTVKPEQLSYGIIGLGRFGTALALELAEVNSEVMVLDADEEKIKMMRNFTENVYIVKSLDKETLRETGIQNCDIVVVCIGDKIDVSILTTLNVINLGVPHVISKATSVEQGEILAKLGAEVVYPERDMAVRLAKRLISNRVFNLLELSKEVEISELKLTERFAGKTVQESNFRRKYGVNVIAIEETENLITDIYPDYVLTAGDTLVVIGKKDGIKRLADDMII